MEKRAMYGERVVTAEAAAFITTIGFFASVATGAEGHRFGREAVARQEIDLVARHQLLRKAFGDVGVRAPGVARDDLDLPAREGIAVQLEVGPHPGLHLLAVVALRPGEWTHDADLDGLLRGYPRRENQREGRQDDALHSSSPRGAHLSGRSAMQTGL
jgi:hypothetical protein